MSSYDYKNPVKFLYAMDYAVFKHWWETIDCEIDNAPEASSELPEIIYLGREYCSTET